MASPMNTDEIIEVSAGYSKHKRTTTIKPGNTYVVRPLNPKKMKNRDRQCTVLGFIETEDGDTVAVVRYLDNNRQGRIRDLADLEATE